MDNDDTKVIISMLNGTFDAITALSQRFDLQEQKLTSLDQRMQDGFASVNARLTRVELNQTVYEAMITRLQQRLQVVEKLVGLEDK